MLKTIDEPLRTGDRRADKREVDLAVSDAVDEVVGEALCHCHGHEWECCTEFADDPGYQRMESDGARRTERDTALLAARGAACRFERVIELRQRSAGVI